MTKFPIFEVTAGKQAGATTGQVHRRAAPGPSTGTIRAHVVPFLGGLPAIGHSLRSLACGTRLQRWQAPGRSRHCTSWLSAVQARRPAAASRRQKKTRTAEVNTVISPLLPLGLCRWPVGAGEPWLGANVGHSLAPGVADPVGIGVVGHNPLDLVDAVVGGPAAAERRNAAQVAGCLNGWISA